MRLDERSPVPVGQLLASKTFLQSLSARERKALLTGPGHGSSQHDHLHPQPHATGASGTGVGLEVGKTNAPLPRQQQQQEQQQQQQQEQQRQEGPDAWEHVQLRVRAATTAADNEQLQRENCVLMQQNVDLASEVDMLLRQVRQLEARLCHNSDARLVRLEGIMGGLRGTVADVGALSQAVAAENQRLASQAAQLLAERDAHRQEAERLQVRVCELEARYVAGLAVVPAPEPVALDGLLTPQVLALSTPPVGTDTGEGTNTKVGPLMKELSALRRQNEALNRTAEGLRVQLRQVLADAKAASQLTAKERAAAARSKSSADARLGSAAQRLSVLTDQVVRRDAMLQEKDSYIRKLEARLLLQHRKLVAAASADSGQARSALLKRASGAAKVPLQQQQGSQHVRLSSYGRDAAGKQPRQSGAHSLDQQHKQRTGSPGWQGRTTGLVGAVLQNSQQQHLQPQYLHHQQQQLTAVSEDNAASAADALVAQVMVMQGDLRQLESQLLAMSSHQSPRQKHQQQQRQQHEQQNQQQQWQQQPSPQQAQQQQQVQQQQEHRHELRRRLLPQFCARAAVPETPADGSPYVRLLSVARGQHIGGDDGGRRVGHRHDAATSSESEGSGEDDVIMPDEDVIQADDPQTSPEDMEPSSLHVPQQQQGQPEWQEGQLATYLDSASSTDEVSSNDAPGNDAGDTHTPYKAEEQLSAAAAGGPTPLTALTALRRLQSERRAQLRPEATDV